MNIDFIHHCFINLQTTMLKLLFYVYWFLTSSLINSWTHLLHFFLIKWPSTTNEGWWMFTHIIHVGKYIHAPTFRYYIAYRQLIHDSFIFLINMYKINETISNQCLPLAYLIYSQGKQICNLVNLRMIRNKLLQHSNISHNKILKPF